MTFNEQETVSPDPTGQETASLKTKTHANYNDNSIIRQCIKTGIGLLLSRNLVSFRLACWLLDFMGVKHV